MVPTQQWPRVKLPARFVSALLVVVGIHDILKLLTVDNFISTTYQQLDVSLVNFVVPSEQILSVQVTRS